MFYGWHIVGVSVVAQAFAIGLTTYVFGLFQKPVAAEFGASFQQVGLGMTLFTAGGSIFSPLLGVALDRYSIRGLMAAGGGLMAVGFGLMSIAPALGMLGLLFGGLVSLGMLALGTNGCSKVVANWFIQYRGRALGISAAGTSVGGLLAPPVMAVAIDTYGWRTALICAACAIALVAVPLVWLVIVNRPEDLGLAADGNDRRLAPELRPAVGVSVATDWTFGALLRERNFWVITLSVGMCFAVVSSVLVNLHPYATDLGIGSRPAALLLSLVSIAGIGGKLLFGVVADRFDTRHAMWLAVGGVALFVGLLLLHPSYAVLAAGSLIGGLALGGLLPVWGALIGRCYGRHAFGRVMGLMNPAMGPLLWSVFPFTGWVRDRTGNYDLALVVFLGAMALAAGVLALLRPPPHEPGT
jgi:MFS family permease